MHNLWWKFDAENFQLKIANFKLLTNLYVKSIVLNLIVSSLVTSFLNSSNRFDIAVNAFSRILRFYQSILFTINFTAADCKLLEIIIYLADPKSIFYIAYKLLTTALCLAKSILWCKKKFDQNSTLSFNFRMYDAVHIWS